MTSLARVINIYVMQVATLSSNLLVMPICDLLG